MSLDDGGDQDVEAPPEETRSAGGGLVVGGADPSSPPPDPAATPTKTPPAASLLEAAALVGCGSIRLGHTGVRWVDWEGVAEISQKKELEEVSDDEDGDHQVVGDLARAEPVVPPPLTVAQVRLKADNATEGGRVRNQQAVVQVDPSAAAAVVIVIPAPGGDPGSSSRAGPPAECPGGAVAEAEEALLLASSRPGGGCGGKDTLEAHEDIVRERLALADRMRQLQDQDNPFRPGGELAREACQIVEALRAGKQIFGGEPPDDERLQQSSCFDSPEHELEKLAEGSFSECDLISRNDDLNDDLDVAAAAAAGYRPVQPGGAGTVSRSPHDQVLHAEVVVVVNDSAKTDDAVTRVVLPDKGTTGCCCCAIC